MNKDKALAISKRYDLDKPAEAVQVAVLLKEIVVQQKLYVSIKNKNYAMVEAWQLAGFLTGMTVLVDEPKNLSSDKEIKYAVTAKIYRDDKVVGVGYAVCSSKEALKKSFDEYAILSMAQTRAIGKAYRNKIGFMMKLAGFQATPGEEMQRVGEVPAEPQTIIESAPVIKNAKQPGQIMGPDGKPTFVCSNCDAPISDTVAKYSMQMYKKRLCRDCQPKKK